MIVRHEPQKNAHREKPRGQVRAASAARSLLPRAAPPPPTRSMYGIDDTRKIGFGLSAAGVLFTVLGVLLFFDRGLLAMGNVSKNCTSLN